MRLFIITHSIDGKLQTPKVYVEKTEAQEQLCSLVQKASTGENSRGQQRMDEYDEQHTAESCSFVHVSGCYPKTPSKPFKLDEPE